MTQNYELIVKGIRNFENKVTVTLALRDKKRFDGEIFDLDISLDRVEGAALEFYEAAARMSVRQVFLEVAEKLSEELSLICSISTPLRLKILPISTSVLIINIYEHKNQIRPVGCRSGADWCGRICSSDT